MHCMLYVDRAISEFQKRIVLVKVIAVKDSHVDDLDSKYSVQSLTSKYCCDQSYHVCNSSIA